MGTPAPSDSTSVVVARQHVWLAALHQLCLADGHFSAEEQRLLAEELTRQLPGLSLDALHQPGTAALVHRLGAGTPLAEEFLHSAVLVALADGHLSAIELEMLRHWSEVLQAGADGITALEQASAGALALGPGAAVCDTDHHPDLLDGVRRWLDRIEPSDPQVARFLVRLIPAQCPFERDVTLFGWKLVHIPPMCKVNPLYDQLIALRFRCLCLLEAADGAGAQEAG